MATAEEKKRIFRRFAEEAWNKGNLDVVYETFSDDYHAHASDPAYDVLGAQGHAEFIGTFRAAFPDVKVHFEHLLSSGDLLVANMWWSGTHQNDYMGLAGTGRPVSVHVIGLNRFEGDKVVEAWGVVDTLGMMQQLGVIPDDAPGSVPQEAQSA